MAERKRFKYEEYLGKLTDVIDAEYSEKTVTVFRTVIELPPGEIDNTPRTLRKEEDILKYESRLTDEKIASLPYERRRRLVGNIGLSCNDSPEAALESIQEQITKKVNVASNDGLDVEDIWPDIMKYSESRGSFIVKYNFNPEAGQFSEFKNQHCNYLPYNDVNTEDYRDHDFKPIEVDYRKLFENAKGKKDL